MSVLDFSGDVAEMVVVPGDDVPGDFDLTVGVFEALPETTVSQTSDPVEVEAVPQIDDELSFILGHHLGHGLRDLSLGDGSVQGRGQTSGVANEEEVQGIRGDMASRVFGAGKSIGREICKSSESQRKS